MSRKTSKRGSARSVEVSRACVWRDAFEYLDPVVYEREHYPDYPSMADGYVDAVLDGRVLENQFVILACERYRKMRAVAASGKGPYFFSPAHVVEACHFIESCPEVQGGDGASGIVLQPCQIWMIANLVGFRETGGNESVRWFVEALLDMPRKGGKSSVTAPFDIYLFVSEPEVGSQILLGASSRSQAEKVYKPIKNILNRAETLREQYGLKVTAKEVRKPDGGFITTVSSIGRKEDGAIPHVIHIDELHAVTHALYEVFSSAMGARKNELFLQTTTAGVDVSGPAYAQRKRLERVLKGQEKADRFFGVIWTVDEEDLKDPLRWENVVKAHPMLGITIKESTVRDDMEKARFNPASRGEFLAKRLNVYSRGSHHALSPDEWRQCEDKALRLEDFHGQECWIGVDLSSHDDQTSIALLFEDEASNLVVFAEHFLPQSSPSFENEKIADLLYQWSNDERKWLQVTSLSTVDFRLVQDRIEELCGLFDVQAVVFDQAHSIQMAGELQKEGIKAGIIQANAVQLSEPTKDFIVRARNKRLRHDGNPVLAWNAANVVIPGGTASELWRPSKDKTAPHMKIDGISAAIHGNVARLGRVTAKVAKPEKPAFDPNRIVRTFR